ncbi:TIGR04283 family arsenosugar biosynthesis glycosyltransferase [Baaleninema sp.]|uniref:TIGR04283 family arsenosugar biosynthesis glycosyltransferase n=1 Tax=Baaleninema sp. TaxID=3101197 RepID=UPI003CFECFEE
MFTRYPQPGRTKTRLVPALGKRGAAGLQRRMTERTLETVRQWRNAEEDAAAEVRFVGGTSGQLRRWLGADLVYRPQGEGDLGDRLGRTVKTAFAEGIDRIALVGIDCPGLSASLLRQGFAALEKADAVLGPAEDGGYYLMALRQPYPELFSGIDWGTETVLLQTLEAARSLGLSVSLLSPLSDIDRPEDLSEWDRATGRQGQRISVVIPALNEATTLPETLKRVLAGRNVEVLVVDGGSSDDTGAIARALGARVLDSPPGRARQMNVGAQAATGEILLFLHADTLLPQAFDVLVRQVLSEPDVVAGAFELQIESSLPGIGTVERGANWRSRLAQLPYGDQGLFLRRDRFDKLGGFPDLPIMEDFEFVRRLRRQGKIAIPPIPVLTSGRRWQRLGILRTTLLNQAIVAAYLLGVSPETLRRWYRKR